MDYGLKKLLRSIEAYKSNHTKVMLFYRKAVIKEQYNLLMEDFEEYAHIRLQETEDSISITISADSILICDHHGRALNLLIGVANTSNFYIKNNQIILELWFRCWEWTDKLFPS